MYHVSVMLMFLRESLPFIDSVIKCIGFVWNNALWSLNAINVLDVFGCVSLSHFHCY